MKDKYEELRGFICSARFDAKKKRVKKSKTREYVANLYRVKKWNELFTADEFSRIYSEVCGLNSSRPASLSKRASVGQASEYNFRIVCSWCSELIGYKPCSREQDGQETSTICPTCIVKHIDKKNEREQIIENIKNILAHPQIKP